MDQGDSGNSCVETPAAPEWLSKLENRREKLKHAKLGHESGAGAPCNECGEKCPGLDLHYWRKVCRNCKCRKDQHMCPDDELSGWAQFKILGQIRSKPAYIKIKALANQSVQLEWVPPNVSPDVVSDYMEYLGPSKIPVAGSNAASKRKQQLEFQVPPHDLDAALCDNLTESETKQLQQYVEKIRENCVGQGSVIRVGVLTHALVGHVAPESIDEAFAVSPESVVINADLVLERATTDRILANVLNMDMVQKSMNMDRLGANKPALSDVASDAKPDNNEEDVLFSAETKVKLGGLNVQQVLSLVKNGPIYDKILADLQRNNEDASRHALLGPMANFRKLYSEDPRFKREVDSVIGVAADPLPKTPRHNELAFNSPMQVKNFGLARFGAQMRQDTPIRKLKFGEVSKIVSECGLPANVDYDLDPVFSQILNSNALRRVFQSPSSQMQRTAEPLIVLSSGLSADDIPDDCLSAQTKQRVRNMGLDLKTLQSSFLNGPFYDQLFDTLQDKGISVEQCKLLEPLRQIRKEILTDENLCEELQALISHAPKGAVKSYCQPRHSIPCSIPGSHSTDSGFHSKPTTPCGVASPNAGPEEMNALAGRFAAIPCIADMNMYPTVEPCVASKFPGPYPSDVNPLNNKVSAAFFNCRDCNQPINYDDVAVKAERAGKDIVWHPQCFKCHTCRELLADLVYFFHCGQVFCGRDLAIKLKIPRCKACDELIFTKEYTAAENSTFHIKHFCCYQCDMPLAGQQYIPDEKSNMPLCLMCYNRYFAASCQRCKRAIGPADQGVAWADVHWHGACFTCAGQSCGKSLIGGRFCVKQSMPFCSPACVRSIIN